MVLGPGHTRDSDPDCIERNEIIANKRHSLEEHTLARKEKIKRKRAELDAAIQAEHVKATLYEDEASIGAFYKRFAEATIDTPETRDQLFNYFIDKIYIGREQLVVASYYHDSAGPIEFEDLEEALTSGDRAGGTANVLSREQERVRQFPLRWRWGDSPNRRFWALFGLA